MTTEIKDKASMTTPDNYQYLVSSDARDILAANHLTIDIKPTDYFPIHGFPFASMLEQIPNPNEYGIGSVNGQIHTVIRADEVGDTDDDTVKNVLARLGSDIDNTHYWKVYAYELDTPNESGMTKMLTTQLDNIPAGKAQFAGFGYKSTETVGSDADSFAAWEAEQNEKLAGRLYYIELCLNKKLMTVMLREADSGQHVADYEWAIGGLMGYGSKVTKTFDEALQQRIADYQVRKERK